MPRLSISDLKRTADRRHWPSRAGPNAAGECFETRDQAIAEDRFRSKSLTRASKLYDQIDERAARKLALQLDYASQGKKPPPSLACSSYLRSRRDRVFSNVWQTVDNATHAVSTFTAIKRGWEYYPEQLNRADPRKLLAGFRSDLNRWGALDASGWLIAWLHGEYDCTHDLYRLHVHGAASGGMVEVVDSLRNGRHFVSGKGSADGVARRVMVSRKRLTDLPYPLTYCLKPYWPKKHVGEEGAPSEGKRNRDHRRIPEPYHSEVLLWLDRWALADITLMAGLAVGKNGFRLTRGCR